jgi:hypothetical protein
MGQRVLAKYVGKVCWQGVLARCVGKVCWQSVLATSEVTNEVRCFEGRVDSQFVRT